MSQDKILNQNIPTEVYWYFGKTGVGKTRKVKELLRKDLIDGIIDVGNIAIIDDFENGIVTGRISDKTEILVLDNFSDDFMKFNDLLALIDGCSIKVKEGKRWFKRWIKAKKIFITSLFSPEVYFPNQQMNGSIELLKKRIKVLQELV